MANKSVQKETPAPINRKRLRKKFPRSTAKYSTRHTTKSSMDIALIGKFETHLNSKRLDAYLQDEEIWKNLEGLGYGRK